jgi:hypothetical protein
MLPSNPLTASHRFVQSIQATLAFPSVGRCEKSNCKIGKRCSLEALGRGVQCKRCQRAENYGECSHLSWSFK